MGKNLEMSSQHQKELKPVHQNKVFVSVYRLKILCDPSNREIKVI